MEWMEAGTLIGGTMVFVFALALKLRGIVTKGRDAIIKILKEDSTENMRYLDHMLLVEVKQPGYLLVTVILGYGVLCFVAALVVPWTVIEPIGTTLRNITIGLGCVAFLGGFYTAWSLNEKIKFLADEVANAQSDNASAQHVND